MCMWIIKIKNELQFYIISDTIEFRVILKAQHSIHRAVKAWSYEISNHDSTFDLISQLKFMV